MQATKTGLNEVPVEKHGAELATVGRGVVRVSGKEGGLFFED
jgi:hypothetical protein